MTKKKAPIDYLSALMKIKHSGISGGPSPNREPSPDADLPRLEDRLKNILGITKDNKRKAANVLFFVMYDIESNKVRRYIVKYLEKQGCSRVQKSVFLADLEPDKFNAIKRDLASVQQTYDNDDSILIVPISTDYLKAMNIIGKNISLDVISRSKSTLFF
ncbi:MAG: CRISPR-associated endonuclease Cas2 [Bacteroidales bacterium]|jgi:CRISPR-associated protein Cas2|nr:CRISPR-associated endonuclease Cas2 [Bacteroidales bacterium]MCI2133521.1 CRISPR-associated endonuclease Cas2 [Bacteroidales bacterium]